MPTMKNCAYSLVILLLSVSQFCLAQEPTETWQPYKTINQVQIEYRYHECDDMGYYQFHFENTDQERTVRIEMLMINEYGTNTILSTEVKPNATIESSCGDKWTVFAWNPSQDSAIPSIDQLGLTINILRP